MRKQFKVGDRVKWDSQANASWKTKIGTVVDVVKAGQNPHLIGSGLPRNHESYVVSVEVGKRVKRNKLYWPRVSALQAVENA